MFRVETRKTHTIHAENLASLLESFRGTGERVLRVTEFEEEEEPIL